MEAQNEYKAIVQLENLWTSVDQVAGALGDKHHTVYEGLESIATAIQNVANALERIADSTVPANRHEA